MQINARLEMNDINTLLSTRGLEPMGRVQKYIDSSVLRLSSPKVPFLSGMLEKSGNLHTIVGSGLVQYNTPYARFLYYGKLMVGEQSHSPWAKQGEIKVLTERDLQYNGAPIRGSFWFERMKAEHKDSILRGAGKIAGGR